VGNSDETWRLFNPELAGGTLLDIGIYVLTMSEMFADSVVVNSEVQSVMSNSGVDESLAIQLKYSNNVLAQLITLFRSQLDNETVIYGTKGKIKLKDFWICKEVSLISENRNEVFVDDNTAVGYNYEIEHINDLLFANKTESDVMPHSRSLKMMQLMDELRAKIGLKYPFE